MLFTPTVPRESRIDLLLELIGGLSSIFGRDDVTVLDLDSGAPLLNNAVRTDGLVIYCSDESARLRFVLRALQQFIDTEPLRQEQNRQLQAKLRRGLHGKGIPVARAG